jgi:hypothetical protein
MGVIKAVWSGFWGAVDGHKTDLVVLAGVVLWLGVVLEWWSLEQVEQLPSLLGLLGVAAFRDALRKE